MNLHALYKNAMQRGKPDSVSFLTKWITKALGNKSVTFLQIGSNDGKTRDPIFDLISKNKKWRGIFVEPVPYLFERLKKNYLSLGHPDRFLFFNGAVNEGINQDFYFVDEHAKYVIPNLPEWYDQIGSFNKEHILSHMDGILEPFIKSIKIKGITLPALMSNFALSQVDLLHVDTEGYDWKILCQLDLGKYQPTIILYEHKHLKNTEIASSIDHLSDKYELFRFKNDFICFHRQKHFLTPKDLKFLRKNYPKNSYS